MMRQLLAGGALAALLGGCAGSLQPPTQPTPVSIQDTVTALGAITADPVTAWQAGNYAVRAACHAYLNAAAARASGLSIASGGLGLAGPAAAGFLVAGGNPGGAAAASSLAALGQSFLTMLQSAGALPYGTETARLIEDAMNAYEDGVVAAPPLTIAHAASYVDDVWYLCSPGGYQIIVTKALSSATVSTSVSSARGLGFRRSARPVIVVNP